MSGAKASTLDQFIRAVRAHEPTPQQTRSLIERAAADLLLRGRTRLAFGRAEFDLTSSGDLDVLRDGLATVDLRV
jgi:hypothetical protein